ncbi:hypothetical protein HK104_006915, partial [Borealophlyctis nickersoniae]
QRGRAEPALEAPSSAPPPDAQPEGGNTTASTNGRLRPPPGFGSQLSAQPVQRTPSPALIAAPAPVASTQSGNWPSAAESAQAPSQPQTQKLKPPPGFGTQLSPTPAEARGASPAPGPSSSPPIVGGDPELALKLQRLFRSDASKLAEFKSLAAAFRQNLIPVDDFLTRFIGLATDGLVGAKSKKEAQAEAGRVWGHLAETVPDSVEDEIESAAAKGKGKKKGIPISLAPGRSGGGKKEAMLRAWNDWKIKTTEYPTIETAGPSSYASSTAKPSSILPPSSARVLVIKSNASKQRQLKSGNYVSMRSGKKEDVWDRLAKEMVERDKREERANGSSGDEIGNVTFAGAGGSTNIDDPPPQRSPAASTSSSASTATATTTSQPQSYRTATSTSISPASPRPTASSIVSSRPVSGKSTPKISAQEFPGLPSRPPRPAYPMARSKSGSSAGSGSGVWGGKDGEIDAEDLQQQQPSGGEERRKGKKKTVLMHFG